MQLFTCKDFNTEIYYPFKVSFLNFLLPCGPELYTALPHTCLGTLCVRIKWLVSVDS